MRNPLEILRAIILSKVEDQGLKDEISETTKMYAGQSYSDISKAGKDNIDQIVDLTESIYPEAIAVEKKVPAKKEAKKTSPIKVGDIVANKTHKSVGIVRAVSVEDGEVATDADGNVPISDVELYSKTKHKDYHTAPSTQKEIDSKKKKRTPTKESVEKFKKERAERKPTAAKAKKNTYCWVQSREGWQTLSCFN